MRTDTNKKREDLARDIEHLADDVATIEILTAHAQPQELRRLQADKRELSETIASKRWQLSELQLQAEGMLPIFGLRRLRDQVEGSYTKLLTGLALLLLLAGCARQYGMPAGHNGEYPTPRVAVQKGGPSNG